MLIPINSSEVYYEDKAGILYYSGLMVFHKTTYNLGGEKRKIMLELHLSSRAFILDEIRVIHGKSN